MRGRRLAGLGLGLLVATGAGACSKDERAAAARRPGDAIEKAATTAFCAAVRNNLDDRAGDLARALVSVAPESVRDDLRTYGDSGDEEARARVQVYVRQNCGDAAAAKF